MKTIYDDVKEIVEMYNPSIMSIEEVFYGKNVKSALLLGHARAVPMVVSANYNMPLYEFSSRKIKQSITGNGNATKEQVQFIFGTALIKDPFHSSRWDYYYSIRVGNDLLSESKLSVFFNGDGLVESWIIEDMEESN